MNTDQRRTPDWLPCAWYVRWSVYFYLVGFEIIGHPLHTEQLLLGILVVVCATANIALYYQVRRGLSRHLIAATIVADFLTICLALFLSKSASHASFLLILPIGIALAQFGWPGGLIAYFASVVACIVLQLPQWLGDAQTLRDGLSSLALLGIASAILGQFAISERSWSSLALALQKTFSALTEMENADGALLRMVQAAAELVRAERVYILLPNLSGTELVGSNWIAGVDASAVEGTRVPRDDGIIWRVFLSGDAYVSPGVGSGELSQHLPAGGNSSIVVPLMLEQESVGVLLAENHYGGSHFTETDAQLLQMLASQAAVIIEYQRVHRALRQERSTLSAILHSIPSGVIVTDSSSQVVLLNSAAEHLLRISEEEALGCKLHEIETDSQIVSVLEDAHRKGVPTTDELTLSTPTNLITRVDCRPVRDENGNKLGQVAIFNDITELRRLDHLKSEFVSAVSHELRTPLTSIKAFTATLLRAEFDREIQREFLNVVNAQCDRLTRLINDLLSISKIESGTPIELRWSRISLRKLADHVVQTQAGFTTEHEFEVIIDEDAGYLDGDEDKLERVLTNLVNNAVKYSPEGGKISVRAKRLGAEVLISVSDQGMGIAPEQLQAVFEKFYQIDGSATRRAGGSGLGLFLVKHLVEAHGGEIWVESEKGKGSVFYFRLPQRHLPGARISPSQSGSVRSIRSATR